MALAVALGLGGIPARAAAADDAERAVTARLGVSPLLLQLELDATTVRVGESVKGRVRVSNAGPITVREIAVSVRVDAAALAVKGGRATISQLQPGKTSTVASTLCGRAPGSYLVLAQATLDGVTIESPAVLLTILPGPGKRC